MKLSRAAGLSSLSIVLRFGGNQPAFPCRGSPASGVLAFPCSRSEESSAFKQHGDAHYLAARREQMTEQTRPAALSCSSTAPGVCGFNGLRRKPAQDAEQLQNLEEVKRICCLMSPRLPARPKYKLIKSEFHCSDFSNWFVLIILYSGFSSQC